MVLAIMVIFLCFRVYQIIQPPPPDESRTFQPPRSALADDEDTPGTPPRTPESPPPEDWRGLWTRPPFLYVRPGETRGGPDTGGDDIDLQLLNIQEVADGSYKVQIRSASRSGWYSEGDAFEAYELLSIDPDTECCIVFSEEYGRRVPICIE